MAPRSAGAAKRAAAAPRIPCSSVTCLGSMPFMRAPTSGLVTTSSDAAAGAPSRVIATAVQSSSMWPISSIAVESSMSR